VDLLRVATALATPVATAMSSLIAIQAAEAMAAGAPHTGLEGELVAGAIAAAEATQTAMSQMSRAAATMPVAESRKFGATNPQARTTTSPPSLHGFAIYFSQRNSNHWGSPSTMQSKI
jgi:poly(3-hydroxybutyrate) depolymerase